MKRFYVAHFHEEVKQYKLDEQIRQTLVLLESKWSEKNIELDIELEEISIKNCEALLAHVWINIIGNAIKFCGDNGHVAVRLMNGKDGVTVLIRDNGIGMNGETMRHIFEKFYQGDSSRKSEGHGIGLALVKKILDLCGGKTSVTSAEGEGSTLKIQLPHEL